MDPLRPFEPNARRPWNRARAAHLLRRSGFAPSDAEVLAAIDDGLEATVVRIMREDDATEHDDLDAMGERIASGGDINLLRAWQLQRMTLTQRPLAARMSVFWHDHFATSNAKVQDASMMLGQLRTFERFGLGRFGDLLLAMSRDPAMIIWLDASANVKGRPNENFARELFELFSLGLGAYTEQDIKEAARAFTGWSQRRGVFAYSALAHDDGEKTVFGVQGRLGGEDIVALCLEQPACARFIGTKLLHEFVAPRPSDALIEAVASQLRATDYDIADVMTTLLMSEAMFDDRVIRSRIKSPVELNVGLVRSLQLRPPATALADSTSQMGQRLFEPASVKGWDGGRDWINATTMLVRMNAGVGATSKEARFDPETLIASHALDDRDSILRFAADVTFDGRAPDTLAPQLVEIDASDGDLLRRALRLLVTSPEYQFG